MIAGAGAVATTVVFLRLSLDESRTDVQTPVSAFSETPPTP
jgi:hypothetical protein